MAIIRNLGSKLKQVFQAQKSDDSCLKKLMKQLYEEVDWQDNQYYSGSNVPLKETETYATVKALPPNEKADFLLRLVDFFEKRKMLYGDRNMVYYNRPEHRQTLVLEALVTNLLRQKMTFSLEGLKTLFHTIHHPVRGNFYHSYPAGVALKHVERFVKDNGLDADTEAFIKELRKMAMAKTDQYYGSDFKKIKRRLDVLLGAELDGPAPFRLSENDEWGRQVNTSISKLSADQQSVFFELFRLAVNASGGKPTKKFQQTGRNLLERLPEGTFQREMMHWLQQFIATKETKETRTTSYGQYDLYEFIAKENLQILRGLVWLLSGENDTSLLDQLARTVERAFRKIPGVGPAAGAVGNAALYVLAQSSSLASASHLSRLKLKIQQSNTRKLIQKYLDEQSKKMGVSTGEMEDLAVPDFGLTDGQKEIFFDDYRLQIAIERVGKVRLTWLRPDGKVQKSVPAFVKQDETLKAQLADLKKEAKQMQVQLTAQRDRLDRSYIHDRQWTYEAFENRLLGHGLMNFLTKRLLWEVENGSEKRVVIFRKGNWQTLDGELPADFAIKTVRLWHPTASPVEEVLAWRNQLAAWTLQQPFKQAYREVYLLTDAEINTRLYSNRMAAHILKQHQFNALSGLRGWKYSLMGAYDDGRHDETAILPLTAHQLQAEYWVSEVNEDGAWNDAGIWHYLATDQVRFTRDGGPVELIEIPVLVFSEIMRDVDLFVGVCSVGNDPQWRDNGGLRQHHDYWQTYAFGDLSETAKTRQAVLEKLVPRLKIRDVARLDGRYLVVKGKLRTYKIHIGSTNILMEPNDQYLCIVPSRKRDDFSNQLFLPFEGDRGLSVILSKAFLLAEDDKIDDPTIVRQIARRR